MIPDGLPPSAAFLLMAQSMARAISFVFISGRQGVPSLKMVISPELMEAGMYVLKMPGYTGYFGIDINPERMPVQRAIEINTRMLRILNDRITGLPFDRIIECALDPAGHRGELEMILAETLARG